MNIGSLVVGIVIIIRNPMFGITTAAKFVGWKNTTKRRVLIHVGCQHRGAVDDDDEDDEGKHAVKKQFGTTGVGDDDDGVNTTCAIEFVGSGDVDEKETRGVPEEVVPIHSPPKQVALLRSSACSSSSLHSERVVCEVHTPTPSQPSDPTSPLPHTIHIVPPPVDADGRLIDISRISILPFSIFKIHFPVISPSEPCAADVGFAVGELDDSVHHEHTASELLYYS
ncbi:hypothetical protein BLNAU_10917 [Blattamonas nauphoetae]|uniref:Uncharacterized protein n=1 Tax=Blattamonas nauphoetae TaxID=2049346 RepID=A0ABQ9XSX9_9EUKA|nr:hypothetical protein BLNAU_10917 [Blattamonas nauphoetae]